VVVAVALALTWLAPGAFARPSSPAVR